MNSILNNELVRKYFGCDTGHEMLTATEAIHHDNVCLPNTALRILLAMQEPIKKGERFLWAKNNGGEFEEMTTLSDQGWGAFHPYILRLPSRFQRTVECVACQGTGKLEGAESFQPTEKKECECVPVKHGANCWHWNDPTQKMGHWAEFCEHQPKPSEAVEEKIADIITDIGTDFLKRNKGSNVKWSMRFIDSQLRELVRLARKEK